MCVTEVSAVCDPRRSKNHKFMFLHYSGSINSRGMGTLQQFSRESRGVPSVEDSTDAMNVEKMSRIHVAIAEANTE